MLVSGNGIPVCQEGIKCFVRLLYLVFSFLVFPSVIHCEDGCLFIRGFITLLCDKTIAIIESLTSVHEITGED